jgi:hypothetical protein
MKGIEAASAPARKTWMKILHMAKRDSGLDDDAYRALLLEATGVASASLHAMTRRVGGVDDIRFLRKEDAQKVILALRDICWKARFNPDGKEGEDGSGNR